MKKKCLREPWEIQEVILLWLGTGESIWWDHSETDWWEPGRVQTADDWGPLSPATQRVYRCRACRKCHHVSLWQNRCFIRKLKFLFGLVGECRILCRFVIRLVTDFFAVCWWSWPGGQLMMVDWFATQTLPAHSSSCWLRWSMMTLNSTRPHGSSIPHVLTCLGRYFGL